MGPTNTRMKAFLTLLLLFPAILSNAQNELTDTVIKGPVIHAKNTSVYQIIGEKNNSIYVIRKSGSGIFLDKTNASMGIDKSCKINMKFYKGNRLRIINGFFAGEHLYLRYYYSKNNKHHILTREIDTKELTLIADRSDIIRNKTDHLNFYNGMVMSSSQKTVLNFGDISDRSSKNFKVKAYVFDELMNLKWEKDWELTLIKKDFTLKSAMVDDSGNVHLLLKRKGSYNISKEYDVRGYDYVLITANKKSDSVKVFNPDIKNEIITNIRMYLNSKDEIMLAGICRPSVFQVNVFSYKLKKENHEIIKFNKRVTGIDLSIAPGTHSQVLTKKYQNAKWLSKIKELKFNEIYSNDEITIFLEEYYVTGRTDGYQYDQVMNSSLTSGSRVTYEQRIYGNITSINIDAEGVIDYPVTVRKGQLTEMIVHACSYTFSMCGKIPFLIFNSKFDSKEDGVKIVKINTNRGNYTQLSLYNTHATNYIMQPTSSGSTGNCGFLLVSTNKKGFFYTYVKLK